MLTRQLVYGPAGAGKSYYANSSWWDSKNKKNIDGREGIWVTFGGEDNVTLGVPEKNRKRFTSAGLDDKKWLKEFKALGLGLQAAYQKTSQAAVYSVIIDGFSEFDILFKQITENIEEEEIKRNQFHVWRELLSEFYSALLMFQPDRTGAHLIATARRGEVKKYVQRSVGNPKMGGKSWTVEEDEWFNGAEAAPSLHGGFKKDLPHYFDFVLYLDTITITAPAGHPRAGQRIPVHEMETMRGGDVYVKNIAEEGWLNSNHPTRLINTNFDEFMGIVNEVSGL
jgi:hypothetical protein